MKNTAPQIARFIAFFEGLTPEHLAHLGEIYAPAVYFKDPFNEVHSVQGIQRIFAHMYQTLEQPRFVVKDCIAQDEQCFLSWQFEFYFKTQGTKQTVRQTIHGASHVKFNAQGLVDFHRDYWDAAEELYEKLPLLGAVMRWLKRRASS